MYDAFGVAHGPISKAKTAPLPKEANAALSRLMGHYNPRPQHVGTPAPNPNYSATAAPGSPESAQFLPPKVDWGKNQYTKKAAKARRKAGNKNTTTTTSTSSKNKGKSGQGFDLSWKNPYVKGAVGAGAVGGAGALGYAALSDRQR